AVAGTARSVLPGSGGEAKLGGHHGQTPDRSFRAVHLHRRRQIRHHLQRQLLFGFELTHHDHAQTGAQVVVDASIVVTGLIGAIVGEIEALPQPGGAVASAPLCCHPTAHTESQTLESSPETGLEQHQVAAARREAWSPSAATGWGCASTTAATMSSAPIPSASASYPRTRRCRNAIGASAQMSSAATLGRPSIIALALPPNTSA